jgi:hypothetical protein
MKSHLQDLRDELPARTRRVAMVRPHIGGLRLPLRSRRFYRGMGLLYIAGSGVLLGAGLAAGTVLYGALWASVIGFLGISMLRGAMSRADNLQLLAKQAQIAADRARHIESVLRVFDYPLTVEEIGRKVGFTNEAVIEGLHTLVAESKVIEDVHLETGEWTYALPNTQAARIQGAGSIDALDMEIERAAAMSHVQGGGPISTDVESTTSAPDADVQSEAAVEAEVAAARR